MYIQNRMKKNIASAFYDKTISILNSVTTIDEEGGVNSGGYDVTDTFDGNVNFSNCKKIQEDFGLDYNIDISITTDYETLQINDFIKYGDIIYNVTDVLPFDSHYLIVGVKWRQ